MWLHGTVAVLLSKSQITGPLKQSTRRPKCDYAGQTYTARPTLIMANTGKSTGGLHVTADKQRREQNSESPPCRYKKIESACSTGWFRCHTSLGWPSDANTNGLPPRLQRKRFSEGPQRHQQRCWMDLIVNILHQVMDDLTPKKCMMRSRHS